MHDAPRRAFYEKMDAANVDLKAFSDDFYWRVCGGRLRPVLDTLEYLVKETRVWTEITTLLIPGKNDSDEELRAESKWIMQHLGPDVPLHFTAFHPDWKMTEVGPTPPATLTRAREIAQLAGLRYVYTGNVHDEEGGSTYCPSCENAVVVRDWYEIRGYHLTDAGACTLLWRAARRPLPEVRQALRSEADPRPPFNRPEQGGLSFLPGSTAWLAVLCSSRVLGATWFVAYSAVLPLTQAPGGSPARKRAHPVGLPPGLPESRCSSSASSPIISAPGAPTCSPASRPGRARSCSFLRRRLLVGVLAAPAHRPVQRRHLHARAGADQRARRAVAPRPRHGIPHRRLERRLRGLPRARGRRAEVHRLARRAARVAASAALAWFMRCTACRAPPNRIHPRPAGESAFAALPAV
jgi:hypothetical protein